MVGCLDTVAMSRVWYIDKDAQGAQRQTETHGHKSARNHLQGSMSNNPAGSVQTATMISGPTVHTSVLP